MQMSEHHLSEERFTLGDSKKVLISLEVSGFDLSPGFEKNRSMSSSDSCCIFEKCLLIV